jgi:Ca2+:H+ antiporter
LFLATIALLVPSTVASRTTAPDETFTQTLSLCLAILLITIYGLGLLFTLKTHREFFGAAEQPGEEGHETWPLGLALGTLGGVTVLVRWSVKSLLRRCRRPPSPWG